MLFLLIFFCSNEEVYICHDGNNAVDRFMQKCGELIKLKPQKVMETIAQYRYVLRMHMGHLCMMLVNNDIIQNMYWRDLETSDYGFVNEFIFLLYMYRCYHKQFHFEGKLKFHFKT